MLQSLHINNILLLENVEISFAAGLCVLTGETGSGKSLVLDSLLCVLGGRAGAKLIRQGQSSGSMAVQFAIDDNVVVKQILADLDIAIVENLIIRRVLYLDGKNKYYVNDVPVSVATVRHLATNLIEIHGQHEQRDLLEVSSHRDIIDHYAKLGDDLEILKQSYHLWQKAIADLASLQAELAHTKKEEEYFRYVVDELEKLAPAIGEESDLAAKRSLLMNKEKLLDLINSVLEDIAGKQNVEQIIGSAIRSLSRNNNVQGASFDRSIEALDRAAIEIQDAVSAIEEVASSFGSGTESLDDVEKRLFTLRAVARKYNCQVDELPAFLSKIQQNLMMLNSQEHSLLELEASLAGSRMEYVREAEKVSALRRQAASKLEKALMSELAYLKMDKTIFKIELEVLPENDWSVHGMDKVRFLMSANPGIPLEPLNKVASGGELSRFMLAAKLVLSEVKSVPTIVFDEIDSGIGGAAADAVGLRLALLSKNMQVVAITHQPQIAAKANVHIHAEKDQSGDLTTTKVRVLSSFEQKEEIARMLSGEVVSNEARAAAEKLLAGC